MDSVDSFVSLSEPVVLVLVETLKIKMSQFFMSGNLLIQSGFACLEFLEAVLKVNHGNFRRLMSQNGTYPNRGLFACSQICRSHKTDHI